MARNAGGRRIRATNGTPGDDAAGDDALERAPRRGEGTAALCPYGCLGAGGISIPDPRSPIPDPRSPIPDPRHARASPPARRLRPTLAATSAIRSTLYAAACPKAPCRICANVSTEIGRLS